MVVSGSINFFRVLEDIGQKGEGWNWSVPAWITEMDRMKLMKRKLELRHCLETWYIYYRCAFMCKTTEYLFKKNQNSSAGVQIPNYQPILISPHFQQFFSVFPPLILQRLPKDLLSSTVRPKEMSYMHENMIMISMINLQSFPNFRR